VGLRHYTLQTGDNKPEVKLRAEASIGIAQWQSGQTMQQLIELADKAMYQEKKSTRKKGAAAGR
jgi:PleD family two-component response regulator